MLWVLCVYYAILYKRLRHPRILAVFGVGGPEIKPLWTVLNAVQNTEKTIHAGKRLLQEQMKGEAV